MIGKIKEHIGRHKVAYSVGTVVIIAGITCVIMRRSYTGILRVPESRVLRVPDESEKVTIAPFSLLSNRQTNNIINIVHREGRGHPGYPVFDLDTHIQYDTQGLAAKALNAYSSNVSAHLKGKLPDVNGHHLVHVTNPLPTQPVKVTT